MTVRVFPICDIADCATHRPDRRNEMTDQEQEPWQEPWPEKMYLLHPSIKTFGAMVSNPERREYVRADRIEELEKRCSVYARADQLFVEEINDLEAKLAKAVEALRETTRMLSQCTFTIIRMGGQYFERHEVVDKANAVLVELEGKE